MRADVLDAEVVNMHIVRAAHCDAVLPHIEFDRLEPLAGILLGIEVQISASRGERLEVGLLGVVVPEMQVFREVLVAVVEWATTVLLRESSVVVVDWKYLYRMRFAVVEDDCADIGLADLVAPHVFDIRLLPLCGIGAIFRRRVDARLLALPVGGVGDAL